MANNNQHDRRVVTETATQARQGRWGKPVLVVLVCGLIWRLSHGRALRYGARA